MDNRNYIPQISALYLGRIIHEQDVNVFYFGHCSGNTPDVHMLTTKAPNFGLNKKEIKFEWPKADEKKDYNFKNYLNPEGNTADLASLNCKKDNKIPESAIIMRYKTGPQLSGRHTIWGNDYEPGQSFYTYTNGKIEDVSVLSKLDNDLDRYYRIGDIVKSKKDDDEEGNNDLKEEFLCIKSSSPYYFKIEAINEDALFINANYNKDDVEYIGDDEASIIAFHMLNAYLLNTGAIKFESYKNYLKSLKDIWKFIDKYPKLKDAYYTQEEEQGKTIYGIKLHIASNRYHLTYNTSDKKYILNIFEENKQDETYFKLNAKSCSNTEPEYEITQQNSADAKKSANEAAKLFNSVGMIVVEHDE